MGEGGGITVQQIQNILSCLDRNQLKRKDGTVAIDGLKESATITAICNFHRACRNRPDGSVLSTGGTWGPATEREVRQMIATGEKPQPPTPVETLPSKKGYQWINPAEFRCRCGGQYWWPAQTCH